MTSGSGDSMGHMRFAHASGRAGQARQVETAPGRDGERLSNSPANAMAAS